MKIFHIALGGCLTAPPVRYGLTEDTGGHIAYVLGAATAQALRDDVSGVTLVTRAFDDPALGPDHAVSFQTIRPKLGIRRLRTPNGSYLTKQALADEIDALQRAFLTLLRDAAHRPDIIHAHFADAAVLARAARDAFDIPFVYTPHSLAIDKLNHITAAAGSPLSARISQERAALQAADAIVVSSRDEAERQLAAYGLEIDGKIHRVWPGVERPASATARSRSGHDLVAPHLTTPERPMILTIARPVQRKNLVMLARCYAASAALQARANLVILAGQHGPGAIGNDETAAVWSELQTIAAAPDMKGLFALPPRHSPEAVGSLYTLAQRSRGVFVNMALHEPFGLTLLEAASHCLPVIAGDRGGPPDIIAQIGHGRVIDPSDPSALETALADLFDNRAAWNDHANNARSNIAPFDWSVWANAASRIYNSLTNPRVPRLRRDFVLGCDIDNTLTGSRDAVTAFNRWHAGRQAIFAVATGRSIVEARRVLGEWDLPLPDVFVTAVGTEIHFADTGGGWSFASGYGDQLDMDWDRKAVRASIDASGLIWQADIEQRRWKFGCLGSVGDADRLRARLRRAGLRANVIPSHGGLIDVIPAGGGKGRALAFVAHRYGLSLQDVIAAGDSGNDIDMLTACGRGIVVGNALPEIAGLRDLPHLYHAQADFAAGVLEGLAFFGLRTGYRPWGRRDVPPPAPTARRIGAMS